MPGLHSNQITNPLQSNCYIYERNRIELSLRRFLFAASVDPLNWWVPRARLAGSTIITNAAQSNRYTGRSDHKFSELPEAAAADAALSEFPVVREVFSRQEKFF